MADNLSLGDIAEVYKTLVAVAAKDVNDIKNEIGTKGSTPEDMVRFTAAVSNFEVVNTATSKAMSSLTDTFKAMLRAQ